MQESIQRVSGEQSQPLSRRLATYSALASAAMLASPAADAALQIWDVNQTLSFTPFSVVANSINPLFEIGFLLQLSSSSSSTSTNLIGPNGNLSFINSSFDDNDMARLPVGIAVGPTVPASQTGSWYGASTSGTGNDFPGDWDPGDQGFVGIRFLNGSDYHYGWVDVSMDAGGLVTVNRWALEDAANTPATTGGAVPEPGTGAMLGLLALGAAGLRRRRQSAA